MTRRRITQGIAAAVVLVVGIAFVVSGVVKAQDLGSFGRTIVSHGVLPSRFVGPTSLAIAATEIFVGGVALALLPARNRFSRLSVLLMGMLLVIFGGYAALLYVRPPSKPTACGCLFGGIEPARWGAIALRNAAIALLVLGAASRSFGIDSQQPDRRRPAPT